MRPLIAEDEPLAAMLLLEQLESAGYEIAGPCSTVAEATIIIAEQALRGAVVDVGLAGGAVFALIDQLVARGIPVVVSTGRRRKDLPERYRAIPLLEKPYTSAEIDELVPGLFGSPRTT